MLRSPAKIRALSGYITQYMVGCEIQIYSSLHCDPAQSDRQAYTPQLRFMYVFFLHWISRICNNYVYILDLISSYSVLSLSMSVACIGHPTPRPSVSLGLGI